MGMKVVAKFCCSLLIFLFLSPESFGQSVPDFKLKDGKSRKISLSTLRAPEFKDSRHGSSGRGYWGAVTVEFELEGAKDDWADVVEVYCQVLASRKNGNPIVIEQTSRFRDVRGNDKCRVQFFIPPTFFQRYLGSRKRAEVNKMSAMAEIRIGGKAIHKKPIVKTATGMPKDWYQQTVKAKRVANSLLPKSETPFAWLDSDYYLYEFPKKAE